MILILHTLIEGAVALLFLFYPGAAELVPGFGEGTGGSFDLLLKMYGLAALLLAALSLIAWYNKPHRLLFLSITGTLALFHLGMAVIQGIYNSDSRAMLLHFLLAIFLGGQYVQQKKKSWATPTS